MQRVLNHAHKIAIIKQIKDNFLFNSLILYNYKKILGSTVQYLCIDKLTGGETLIKRAFLYNHSNRNSKKNSILIQPLKTVSE